MSLTKDLVREALSGVRFHDTDLVAGGALQWVAACDAFASVRLFLGDDPGEEACAQVAARAEVAIRGAAAKAGGDVDGLLIEFVNHAGNVIARAGDPGASAKAKRGEAAPDAQQSAPKRADVSMPQAPKPQASRPGPQDQASSLPGVKHVIAVGAGKGGVGKSTIAVNLAVGLALAKPGRSVGLLDGDIYGPSLPTMLGLASLEQHAVDGKLEPFSVHGIKAVSIGKMVEPDKPLIWRGPMAHGAFNQLVTRTNWGELDHLIIDLPPGTGDVPLTMAQQLRLTGAVIVCTPQRVAQDDAVRAAKMFEQLGIEVLGVVENMSYFIGDDGKEYDLFGRGGAEHMAQKLGVPYLGAVPINTALRMNGDEGLPLRNFDPGHAGGETLPTALRNMTRQLEAQVTLAAMQQGATRPTLSIS